MIYLFLHNRRNEKRRNAVSGIEAKVRSGIVRSGSGKKDPRAKTLLIDNDTCLEGRNAKPVRIRCGLLS